MKGELIPTGVTFGVGRNSINDQFSGTGEFNNIILDSGANFSGGSGGGIIFSAGTDLYDIFNTIGLWSAGTGLESIIQINSDTPNLASGEVAVAIGKGSQAVGENSFVGGYVSVATGLTSFAFGNSNSVYAINSAALGGSGGTIAAVALNGVLFGGHLNNITRGSNASIIGGSANTLSQGAIYPPHNSSIIGGNNNSVKSINSVVVGGDNAILTSSNSVILGGTALSGFTDNTAFMQIADINEYMDLNPQTSLPAASIGRLFFSGGSLNRIMYCTGATAADWIVV